jgi:acyl-CoA thioesterase
MQTISELFKTAKTHDQFEIDESWGQGRSVFGGISAAMVLEKLEDEFHLNEKDLRSINVSFCGAVTVNEPCIIQCQMLSEGRSVMHIQGQLIQDGHVKTHVMACYALSRESSVAVNAERITPVKSFKESRLMPFIAGLTPNFVQHVDMAHCSNTFPFSGADTGDIFGWMGFKQPPDAFNDSAILALIDAWPPTLLSMLKQPAPASSITWSIEFVQPRAELSKDDILYYECLTQQAADGYGHTQAKIYHPNGELIALSRQLVGVYDKRTQTSNQ